jgi:hypothetical protein
VQTAHHLHARGRRRRVAALDLEERGIEKGELSARLVAEVAEQLRKVERVAQGFSVDRG